MKNAAMKLRESWVTYSTSSRIVNIKSELSLLSIADRIRNSSSLFTINHNRKVLSISMNNNDPISMRLPIGYNS